jgi:hypothetical protein
MMSKGRGRYAGKTHCKNGHELIGDNLILVVDRGSNKRVCRTCQRAKSLKYYYNKKLKTHSGNMT